MNKKLNITAVEYQHKVRQQSKARTIKFREEQERRGYKNLTAYLSEPFRAELERLATEQGLNRQAAMDYIFRIYLDNVNNSVTSNVILTEDKATETPVNPGPLETVSNQLTKAIEPNPVEAHALVEPVRPILETQTEIPGPMPERGTPEYTTWLFQEIKRLNDTGLGWAEIADKFNADGTRPSKADSWKGGQHLRATFKYMEKNIQ